MFHKRLMKEFKENQKYVAGMVATQWGSLLCNVALMYAIGVFLEKLLLYNRTVGEGDIAKLFIVFAAVYMGVQYLQALEAIYPLPPQRR